MLPTRVCNIQQYTIIILLSHLNVYNVYFARFIHSFAPARDRSAGIFDEKSITIGASEPVRGFVSRSACSALHQNHYYIVLSRRVTVVIVINRYVCWCKNF